MQPAVQSGTWSSQPTQPSLPGLAGQPIATLGWLSARRPRWPRRNGLRLHAGLRNLGRLGGFVGAVSVMHQGRGNRHKRRRRVGSPDLRRARVGCPDLRLKLLKPLGRQVPMQCHDPGVMGQHLILPGGQHPPYHELMRLHGLEVGAHGGRPLAIPLGDLPAALSLALCPHDGGPAPRRGELDRVHAPTRGGC